MNTSRFFLFVNFLAVAFVALANAQNAPPRLPLDRLMSKEDQAATGVSNLTDTERAALEVWLTNFGLRVMQAGQNPAAPKAAPRAAGPYAGLNVEHWIKAVVERGQTIQLDDGSLWQINPFNKIDAILWMGVERVTVIESNNPLYPYKLVNTDSKSAAEAKLISK